MHGSLIGGGRISYIDALRGLAIILVVEGHVREIGMGIGSYDSISSLMLYTFDLPLFFVISGYLAYRKIMPSREIYNAIWKKIIFLVIPAIVFRMYANIIEHRDAFSPLFHGFGKYWFTITLFECFLIYYVFQLLIKNERLKFGLLITLSFLSLSFLGINSTLGPSLLDSNHLFKYFYFFVIGIFAKRFHLIFERIMTNNIFKSIVIIGFFCLLSLMDYSFWPSSLFHLSRDIVLRILGTAFIISVFMSNKDYFESNYLIVRLLKIVGRYSLPIYLLQYFFLPDFGSCLVVLHKLDEVAIYLLSFLYTILIVSVCMAFIWMLKESPFVKKYILGIR